MNNQLVTINFVSMTSKEIAELTGKQLSHVNRDIKVMLEQLKNEHPNLDTMFKTVSYPQKVGFGEKQNEMFYLNKKLALILVSGYSAALRSKIINRWQELEAQQQIKLPTTRELAQMVIAAEDRADAAEAKVKMLTHQGKLYTSTEIAKELGYRSAQALNKLLVQAKIIYKVNGTYAIAACYADKQYHSTKQTQLNDSKAVYNMLWTGAGREWLLNKFWDIV